MNHIDQSRKIEPPDDPSHPGGAATIATATEFDHGRILAISLDQIAPAPENDQLYRPVDETDPDIIALAESITKNGLQEPVVVSDDGYILSGHRRHTAARLAGLSEIPCRVHPIRRELDPDGFTALLREFNRQRVKSFDEKVREEVVSVNPDEAYQSLIEHRKEKARPKVSTLDLGRVKQRPEISKAKAPLLAAVQKVIEDLRDYWPLSDRRIHYNLLNDPPLIHASKTGGRYANNKQSYRALTELLTRARIAKLIPMDAIGDETRPVSTWNVNRDVQGFVRDELGGLLKNYWRDLMQSQPCHIEILCEKNTIRPILEPIAARYCIPLVTGRGFCSLPPRHELTQRFHRSGKDALILLIVSDHDPEGMTIASSFGRSIRDDFGIEQVQAIKVALTQEQVKRFKLPPGGKAKQKSSSYTKFVAVNGDNVWELEALSPEQLQQIVTDAIDSVLDRAAFNHELDREREDAASLEATRRHVLSVVGTQAEGE